MCLRLFIIIRYNFGAIVHRVHSAHCTPVYSWTDDLPFSSLTSWASCWGPEATPWRGYRKRHEQRWQYSEREAWEINSRCVQNCTCILLIFIYIYYIYMCVLVCVCVCVEFIHNYVGEILFGGNAISSPFVELITTSSLTSNLEALI